MTEAGAARQPKSESKKADRGGRTRRISVVVLVVLASLIVPLATTAVWARRTVVNTEVWVDTMGPVAGERAVQVALADYLTTQIMGVLDVPKLVADVLPERGKPLVAPLTQAVEGFVHDTVDRVLQSEEFQRVWVAATRKAQQAALKVLRGQGEVLRDENGKVVLDLLAAVNNAIAGINSNSPEVLGREIKLPTISPDDVPQQARARLSQALGRPIPENFGQIELFDAKNVSVAQKVFHLAQRAVVLLVVLALALVAAALWLSRARRRTLFQLLVGIALGTILVRRVGLRTQSEVLDLIKVETNRLAVEVTSDQVLSGLLAITKWMLIACVVTAAVAAVTAPYPWAVSLRRATAGHAALATAGQPGDPTAGWVIAHLTLLKVAGLVAAGLVLLVLSVSWLGLLVLAVLVAAYELWLARLGAGSGS